MQQKQKSTPQQPSEPTLFQEPGNKAFALSLRRAMNDPLIERTSALIVDLQSSTAGFLSRTEKIERLEETKRKAERQDDHARKLDKSRSVKRTVPRLFPKGWTLIHLRPYMAGEKVEGLLSWCDETLTPAVWDFVRYWRYTDTPRFRKVPDSSVLAFAFANKSDAVRFKLTFHGL